VSQTFIFCGRLAQLQHNLDIPRTCKQSSWSAGSRSLTLPVSYLMKTRTTVQSASVKRVAYCSATWSKSRISTIRSLSVSHFVRSLKFTHHTFFSSGGNPFTNRTRDVAKDLRAPRVLEHARVSVHVGTEQRKAPQGRFYPYISRPRAGL
jgi:hypothetical protein